MQKNNFLLNILFIWLFLGMSLLFSETIRIMPLGDSITYDQTYGDTRPDRLKSGYRNHLWYKLSEANYAADFVGSQIAGQSVIPEFDTDNEGHPGWTSFDIAEKVHAYLTQNNADIILLHIGTNDHSTFTGGVDSILQEIDFYEQQTGRSVRVMVALIIDRQNQADLITQGFNTKLKKLIAWRASGGDSLTMIDMYRGAGLTSADYIDFTHPNDSGYQKMATVWFNALMSPYTPELYTFPATVVDRAFIESLSVNEATKSVTFTVDVPDTGITF